MKKNTGVYFCAALFLPAILFAACAGEASSRGASFMETGAVFKDVQGKEWTLLEIRSQGKTVSIDRKKLEAGNMGGAFSIAFDENQVSGMGAPNRYFGLYTVVANNGLNIGNLASTKMLAFNEPEELKEDEYFAYLSKASRWNLRSEKLEIYSANSTGTETVLIFGPK